MRILISIPVVLSMVFSAYAKDDSCSVERPAMELGGLFTVDYTAPYPTCTGCVNPSNQFTNAGKTCFVKLAGNNNFVQGGLGQLHSLSGSNPPTTDVPLDDYTWVLLIVMGAIGVILISRKGFSLE